MAIKNIVNQLCWLASHFQLKWMPTFISAREGDENTDNTDDTDKTDGEDNNDKDTDEDGAK